VKIPRLLVLATLLGACTPVEIPPAKVGEKLAPLDLPTFQGGFSRSEEWSGGQPVVVNFWATWCQPCLFEIPVLQDLHRSGAVKIVSITLDKDRAELEPFVLEHGIDYPILLGDLGLLQDLGSNSIPFTLVLDRELEVKRIHRALVSARTLEQDLAAAR
jgi:thiol-disulfide isomerase/thioredoxin